jgi:D-alanyl-D-alanine carboxypeptidase
MSGTSAEIFSGEKYTLEQLFYGMMLPSGNDAALAIANEGGLILK